MNDKIRQLDTLLDEIRQRINAAETQKLPYDFMAARRYVQEAKEIIIDMKEENNE